MAAIWNITFLDKLLSIELTKSFWEFLMLHIKKCLGHSPQRLLFQYNIKNWIWFWYGAPSSMHMFESFFFVYFPQLFFRQNIVWFDQLWVICSPENVFGLRFKWAWREYGGLNNICTEALKALQVGGQKINLLGLSNKQISKNSFFGHFLQILSMIW